ncbi:MAG TPA: response regulator [Kofleriaceae bacterium]|nr:response regulator [Kofleriaceae bacterium]
MTRDLAVAVFDDVVFARGESFRIPGLVVTVYAHADNATHLCAGGAFDVVFMDFAMGTSRKSGRTAIAELRRAGFCGRIIAISSDPVANDAMREAGADEALAKKAHLRSFLVQLGAQHLRQRASVPTE